MNKKILHYFQQDAVTAIIESLKKKQTPYVNAVTGFGKSLVMAHLTELALKKNKTVLQLVPNHTLCEQNFKQTYEYISEPNKIGICCAKLKRYETGKQCVIATQTTIIRRIKDLSFNVCLIDECFSGDTLIDTIEGKKRIDEIRPNDIVYNAIGTGIVSAVSVKNHTIIYKIRLSNGQTIKTTNNHPIFTQYGWVRTENLDKRHFTFSIQDMRKLWKNNKALEKNNRKKKECSTIEKFQRNKILLNKLLETERTQQQNSWRNRKDGSDIKKNWSQTYYSRWEWKKINGTSNFNVIYPWRRLGDRTSNPYKNTKINENISNLLQGRYRESKVKNSYRIGWGISQWEKKRIRQEKRFIFNLVRVESVSIEKSGSDTPMYNLSVEGHPSYFAGGILVHNCDLVGIDETNTYRKILAELKKNNPSMVIIGLTGSPYRQDQGMIHQGDNAVFTECCYESDIPRLISEGYLSSVKTLNTPVHVDLDGVKIVKGEYDQTECGVRFHKIVDDAVQDFKRLFKENEIKTALIFASTIANGQRIVDQYGDESECKLAHGGMTTHQRAEIIRWLTESKGNRYLVNVGLYTRGFDFPELQCLVLLRATDSMRLYVQILGRVLRTHEEKEYGYLIDYGTNVERFGPIDQLKPPKEPGQGEAPYKLCLECGTQNRLAAKTCKECEAVFIPLDDESGKYTMKTKAQVIQEKEQKKWEYIDNPYLTFELAFSKKDGTPMVKMKVHDKFRHVMDYYICIEHRGRAGKNAVNFLFRILKDQKNFMELSKNSVLTAENLALLFSIHYDKYFKKMTRIVIGPGEGRFKEIKGVSYE